MQKEHGPFNFQWIYGSSPLLYRGKLYVQVLHRDVPGGEWRGPKPGESLADSYIVAKNPETGKDIWKVVRKDDDARWNRRRRIRRRCRIRPRNRRRSSLSAAIA